MEKSMDDHEIDYQARQSINRFSDPDVNFRVMGASTPGAAKKIIETLPGVNELVHLGPQASKPVLNFLQQEETLKNHRLSAVALYLLERLPSPEATQVLAGYINARTFRGINSQLAAEAFLKSVGIEVRREKAIATALVEARKY